jgi:hypothetical protein
MEVLEWYPLLTPQILFKDRQGETNAYLETNPALYIAPDATFICMVRLVNYRKFKNRNFKMGGALSESRYHMFRGAFGPKGPAVTESSPVTFTSSLPQYYSCWTGYEDIRFLDERRIICTSPTASPAGKPVLVTGVLDGAKVSIDRLCLPAEIEKNWMPFRVGSADFVIYSVCPLALKGLNAAEPQILAPADELKGFHGSTNGIVWGTGFLFIIHTYAERTQHKWLYFDPVARRYGYSESFSFNSYSYIEFTCSLCAVGDALWVALGMNDDKAYLCRVASPDLATFKMQDF